MDKKDILILFVLILVIVNYPLMVALNTIALMMPEPISNLIISRTFDLLFLIPILGIIVGFVGRREKRKFGTLVLIVSLISLAIYVIILLSFSAPPPQTINTIQAKAICIQKMYSTCKPTNKLPGNWETERIRIKQNETIIEKSCLELLDCSTCEKCLAIKEITK